MSANTRVVAIVPAGPRSCYPELLRALEEGYPVRFVGSTDEEIGAADAVIVLPGGRRPGGLSVPCLELGGPPAVEERGSSFTVEMSRCEGLDRALRGQRLTEEDRMPPPPIPTERGCRVLATVAGKPVWIQSTGEAGHYERASSLPSEVADHEFLRDHLAAGRFWSLLPLAHFLKRISFGLHRATPHCACFVIDDPNVRFSSYGHVRFPELGRDARDCGYHVAVATIPLDLMLPGRRASGLFAEFGSQLSLVVHGNDHLHRELERPRGAAEADKMIAAAAARVDRFEKRAGIRIERVMCPPHGACGPEVLSALFRCGFLALAASRPFPWDDFSEHRRWRLGRWLPAQLAGGGLPVLPRYPLSANLDDLAFRAFLGQPLILYGHQSDLRHGLEPFRTAAALIAALGDVRWMSLASITRGNATCRTEDGAATVTPYSRDLRIARPSAGAIRVQLPRILGAGSSVRVLVDGTTHDLEVGADGAAAGALAEASSRDELVIRVEAPGSIARATTRDQRLRAWPLARRAMTETRDRTVPLVRNVYSRSHQ